MAYDVETITEPYQTHNEDRVEVIGHDRGRVIVLADGAGGTSGGAQAAEATIQRVRDYVAQISDFNEPDDWRLLLAQIDVQINGIYGETTCVVAAVSNERVAGASVGDSAAWLIGRDTYSDLTAQQFRKPLLGSGRAKPIAFESPWQDETLLVASDGLVKYAPLNSIYAIARQSDLMLAARELVDLVRLNSGALPDDVTVALCRKNRAARVS